MSRKSSAYVYLAFWGKEFSPQEFSVSIGLQATSFRIKGEEVRVGVLAKECLWEYKCSSTDDCTGLDESLEQLRVTFAGRTELIRRFMLAHGMESRCTVVLTIREVENPGLRLSPQFILFLAEIGAGFELDGYQ
jgi:hypothetical protein